MMKIGVYTIILAIKGRKAHRSSHLPREHLAKARVGRELAPAFETCSNRLLWRLRARPSTTLDKRTDDLD